MSSGNIVGDVDEVREETFRVDPRNEQPAVGLILRRNNEDAVTRVVLRAAAHGHAVFLTYQSDPDRSFLNTLCQFNVHVVQPNSRTDNLVLLSMLLDAARKEGHPGLIFHEDPEEYIDYERTNVRITESQTSIMQPVTARYPPSKQESHLIVGIPVYNEEETVQNVVSGSSQYSDTVIVIDDGSEDDTSRRASEAGATVLRHETNKGYGAALQTLFREAMRREAKQLVVLDGDDQHDPDDIPRLVEFQRTQEADLVIGNRFGNDVRTDMPSYRRTGLKVVNGLTNLSLGILPRGEWISDTQSGFRVYSKQAIQTLARDESLNDGMAASTDILDHAISHNYRIAEIGTEIDYDVVDGSTHAPISHGFVLVSNILKKIESRRPLTFIGIPGFGIMLFSLTISYWIISPLLSTGTVSTAPILVAIVSFLLGTVACVTSLILHSLHIMNGHYDATPGTTDG
ncbi:DPM/DPG synthase family glycosyltransferase [Halosimplex halobium]|uniref:glycosyltransferase family 2 protein n=1 Tax=Halosimplex halobium TaxID=3396618 RepID=UPI003F569B8D